MSEVNGPVTFHVTPGYGELARERLGYSQAVRIGNRVEISGQGGWDDELAVPEDLETEIVQAFDNVGRTLAEAGARWADVVHVNSYHRVPAGQPDIGVAHNDVMAAQFRERAVSPIWTQTGVTVLGLASMRVEIRVTAIVGGQYADRA